MSGALTPVDWDAVAARATDLEPVAGGASMARRGLLRLPGGRPAFVKIGADAATRAWAQKEVRVYERLRSLGFAHAPQLLAHAPDATGFVLEALTAQDGWDWSDHWSEARLQSVLAATDALAALAADQFDSALTAPTLTARADGWPRLDARAPATAALLAGLDALGGAAALGEVERRLGRPSRFPQRFDTLIHLDVRSDNCAWQAATGAVRLVDWNWLQIGDRRIDHAAFLTTVHLSGFDVRGACPERLSPEALTWMAGYWMAASTRPIWPGGPSGLRGRQLRLALTALQLASG